MSEESKRYVGDPFVVDDNAPWVPMLLGIFKRQSGVRDAAAVSLRGATYARLFPGGVSFGPGWPGEPYPGHEINESIRVDRLHLLVRMLAEAAMGADEIAAAAKLPRP